MLEKIKRRIEKHQAQPIGEQRTFAVFLPLVKVDEEWHVLYEVRSNHISQPGETSFPGGAVEEGESFEEAAVRETMEELNVSKDAIEVYGEIDFIFNQSHHIRCFVGELKHINPDQLQPNEEVASVFTIPLRYLKENEPEYHTVTLKTEYNHDFPFELISNSKKYKFCKRKHKVPFYRLPNQFLWGFTADFTHRFIEIISEDTDFLEGKNEK